MREKAKGRPAKTARIKRRRPSDLLEDKPDSDRKQRIKSFCRAVKILAANAKVISKNRGKYSDYSEIKDSVKRLADEFYEELTLDFFNNISRKDWMALPESSRRLLIARMADGTVNQLKIGESEKVFLVDGVGAELHHMTDVSSEATLAKKAAHYFGDDHLKRVRRVEILRILSSFKEPE